MAELTLSRIAPTPSGYLHIGNAFNFLLTEAIVRSNPGRLRLRIDDLDAPRTRPEYLQDIFESLAWLGVHYDEGPENLSAQENIYSQRLRLDRYTEALEKLVASGQVFACNCSRKILQETAVGGQYPGTCLQKNIPLDTQDVSWRLNTPEDALISFEDAILGGQHIRLWDVQNHFLIRRRDGLPAYHVASLCDDIDYGINTIVRGSDLLTSTAAQLWLAQVLGFTAFRKTQFFHHPLLTDDAGDKLSKSAGSTSLKAMRAQGLEAAELRKHAQKWWQAFAPGLK